MHTMLHICSCLNIAKGETIHCFDIIQGSSATNFQITVVILPTRRLLLWVAVLELTRFFSQPSAFHRFVLAFEGFKLLHKELFSPLLEEISESPNPLLTINIKNPAASLWTHMNPLLLLNLSLKTGSSLNPRRYLAKAKSDTFLGSLYYLWLLVFNVSCRRGLDKWIARNERGDRCNEIQIGTRRVKDPHPADTEGKKQMLGCDWLQVRWWKR